MKININKISLQNFMIFGSESIDFTFRQGLHLITGKNGSGKSSLLNEVLSFCWYGKPYREIKIEKLFNRKNKKNLKTYSEFTINDRDKYEISRNLQPDSFQITKNGEDLKTLSSKKLNQDEIDKIIGAAYNVFKNAISLSISYNTPFLKLKSEEKRKLIDNMFSLAIIGKMLANVKKQLSEKTKKLELLIKDYENLYNHTLLLRTQCDEFKAHNKKIENDKQTKIKNCEESIINLKNNLKTLEFHLAKKDRRKDRILKVLSKFDLKFIEDFKKSITNIIFENQTKIAAEKSRKESLEKHVKDIGVIKTTIVDKSKVAAKNAWRISRLESLKFNDKELNDKNIEFAKEFNIIKFQRGSNNDRIKFLNENEICPTCKNVMTEEHRYEEIRKLNNEELILIERQRIITVETNKISKILNKISKLQKQLLKTSSENTFIELNLRNDIEKLDKLQELIDKSNNDFGVDILNLQDDIDKGKIKLREIEKKLTKIKNLKNIIADVELKIIQTNYEIKNNESNITKLLSDLDNIQKTDNQIDLKKHAANYETKREEFVKMKTDRKLLEGEVEDLNVMVDVLSDKGAKSYIIDKLVPLFNKKVNEYLDIFEIPVKIIFDKFMNAQIYDVSGVTEEISYYSNSAGEQKRIDFAIMLSLIETMKIISNWNSNILLIDELLDGSVDGEGLEKMVVTLKQLAEDKQLGIYLISHRVDNSLDKYFGDKFEISRTATGFGKVEKL